MKITWWKWLPFQRWRVVGAAEAADQVPDCLPRNGVALVAASGRTKWIVFDCPCRTGHRIMLNADASRRPYWAMQSSRHLTIFPSIDFRGKTTRCHYFIRNGQIQWAKDGSP